MAAGGRTVREATYAMLGEVGMTTIFGNPGSTELRLFRDWPGDFSYVLGLQEATVVAMADGFARARRDAALVNLHSAAGLGHGLGSLFTAYRNQTPLVVTAGQQTRAMLATEPFLFARDAPEFPRPYVKWSTEPPRAADVPAALARAYWTAMEPPRGPTFVSIPEDDWDAPAGDPVGDHAVRSGFVADGAALEEVAGALATSTRPALVVGAGVDEEGAWDEVVALAERLRARVWANPLASRAGFPEDHQAFAGFLVPHRRQLADQLAPHDVVVVLGGPVFPYHVHAEGPFLAAGTRLFHLDDDPEAAAYAPVGTSVLTTLRPAVAALVDLLPDAERPLPPPRTRPAPPAVADPIRAEAVMAALASLLPDGAVVVEEAPSHRNALHDHLPIRWSGGFYTTASGGLGWSLPAAVGVALAQPDRRVVALLGDGATLYSVQALWTAAQWGLPVTAVVLRNGAYEAMLALGGAMGVPEPPGVALPEVDFPALARGFGCQSLQVGAAAELQDTLAKALAADQPVVVDVPVALSGRALY